MASALSRVSAIAMEATRDLQDRMRSVSPGKRQGGGGEIGEIRGKLDSRFEAEKLDAMKRLVNLMSKGRDCSEFFPHVIKNVTSSSMEVRRLVYIFMMRYAEKEPDVALLSINSFQKDLTDKNPMLRATSLKVMSSIKVPVIVPVVVLAVKKAITDLSPYVRKAAAASIGKCHALDPSQHDSLMELLVQALSDLSPIVIGSAVGTFNLVCPEELDLLNKLYRRYCKMMLDIDEWGQLEMLTALHRYVRKNFTDPTDVADNAQDSDLQLLLSSTAVLFLSRNPAVVLKAIAVYTDLTTPSKWTKVVPPVLRLTKSEREQQYIVLRTILTLARRAPGLFDGKLRHFIVFPLENKLLRNLKLKVIVAIASEANSVEVWRELQVYMHSPERSLVLSAIRAVGELASKLPGMAEVFVTGLMALISKRNETLLPDILLTLRVLLQLKPSAAAITRLTKLLDLVSSPAAKASILWLVGEYCSLVPTIAPDIVRRFVAEFKDLEGAENVGLKLQVLTMACKVYLEQGVASSVVKEGLEQDRLDEKAAGRLEAMLRYLLEMARFDLDYDVRDRARLLRALVLDEPLGHETGELRKLAKGIMLGKKKVGAGVDVEAVNGKLPISTLSHFIGHPVKGYEPLPEWAEVASDATLRAVEGDDPWTRSLQPSPGKEPHRRTGKPAPKRTSKLAAKAPRAPAAAPQPKPKKRIVNLDNWFNESEEEEDDEPAATASRPAASGTAGSDGSSKEDSSEEEEGSEVEDESSEEHESESGSEEESVSESDSSEDDNRPATSSQAHSDIPTEGIANLSLDSERTPAAKGSWSSDDEEAAVPIRAGTKK